MDAALSLRRARTAAGLTQGALAARAGTSQATVSAYESGRKQPSIETLDRLLRAMGQQLTVRRTVTTQAHRQPSAADLRRADARLADVLSLAAALPTRHPRALRFPPLHRAA